MAFVSNLSHGSDWRCASPCCLHDKAWTKRLCWQHGVS